MTDWRYVVRRKDDGTVLDSFQDLVEAFWFSVEKLVEESDFTFLDIGSCRITFEEVDEQ